MSPYQIITETDGENHVKVVLPVSRTDYQLIWNFTLEGDDEPIILKKFYSPTRFVIVNWNGWVRICDVSTKEIIVSENLGFSLNTHAVISTKLNNLYIVGSNDQQTFFTAFNLDGKPEITVQVEITDDYYLRSLDLRKDGNLLMYFNDHDSTPEGDSFNHGFLLADLNQSKITVHPLPYPQLNTFELRTPLIIKDFNRGFLPLWERVKVTQNEDGEDLFEFAIMVFTLDSFEVTHKIPIRYFKEIELAYFESDCPKIAKTFKNGIWNDDYIKQLWEFIDDLNSMVYDAETDSVWLCWRGGILVRMKLEDYSLSPLLVTASLPNSSIKGAFKFPHFHSEIDEVTNDYIIIKEHNDYYEISLINVDLNSTQKLIEVAPTIHKKNIISSAKEMEEEQFRTKNMIEVKDFNTSESIHDALDQICLITKNIDKSRKGDILEFAVKDSKGVVMCDDEFFELAAKADNALEKIAIIVRQFAAYSKASQLYINEEETALCYANFELAKADPDYLDDVFNYLTAIDADHDVFNCEILIPLLVKKYRNTEHINSIIKRLTEISEFWVEGIEMYLEENDRD